MYADKYVSTCPKFLCSCLHCLTKSIPVLDETLRRIRCCNGLCTYQPPMLWNRSSSKLLFGDHLHLITTKVMLGGSKPNLLLCRDLPTHALLQHQLGRINLSNQDFSNDHQDLQGQVLHSFYEDLKMI